MSRWPASSKILPTWLPYSTGEFDDTSIEDSGKRSANGKVPTADRRCRGRTRQTKHEFACTTMTSQKHGRGKVWNDGYLPVQSGRPPVYAALTVHIQEEHYPHNPIFKSNYFPLTYPKINELIQSFIIFCHHFGDFETFGFGDDSFKFNFPDELKLIFFFDGARLDHSQFIPNILFKHPSLFILFRSFPYLFVTARLSS